MIAVIELTPKYCTAPRSLTTSIMASVTPTTSGGRDSGSVMAKNVRIPPALNVRAAILRLVDCIRKKARHATYT